MPQSQTAAHPRPHDKRKRKPTNLNKHKPNKRTKSTKISSLFPKRANRNTKRTEKHKNKMTHGKTYNKSPRRINYKATKSKTNTGTTALERSVEQTTGGFKALLQLANFTLVPMLLLIQKYITRGPWWFYIAHLSKQICILILVLKFTALNFIALHPHPPPTPHSSHVFFFLFNASWQLNLERGSPKEHFCQVILKLVQWFLTKRFLKYFVSL